MPTIPVKLKTPVKILSDEDNPMKSPTPSKTPGDRAKLEGVYGLSKDKQGIKDDRDGNLADWAKKELLYEEDPMATREAQKTMAGTPPDDKNNMLSPGDDDRHDDRHDDDRIDGQNVNLMGAFNAAEDEKKPILSEAHEKPQEEDVSKIKKFFGCFKKRDRAQLKNKKHKKKTKHKKKRKPTKKRKHTKKTRKTKKR